MEIAFWSAFIVIAYVYAGYPVLLAAWARVASRPVRSAPATPAVSIVLAARNEAAALEARIQNLRALDYPADKVQIVVVSDGSTDRTPEILRVHADRVDAVLVPPGGKALALNAGVAAARHGIIVFTDARQAFAGDALRALVAPFADPEVGGVTGELVLDCERGVDSAGGGPAGRRSIGEGIGAYWRYEKWLRNNESLIGSTVGATGAIYALRRDLWQPLPADTILDDVLAPMQAVLAGSRVVFERTARAFDRAAAADVEFRRKTRTLAGNYQILRLQPRLLLPFVNPVWWQFVSHKVGRLLVPWALAVMVVSSAALSTTSAVYALAFAGQVAFYGLALYGAVLDQRLARISYTFVMMNLAAVTGLVAASTGRRVWR
jgi:biofilm PGA synthesis N-glycosyltransferase PgaC